MRYKSRLIAFALSLSLGTAVWYTLAYSRVTSGRPVQSNMASATRTRTPTPAQPQAKPARFIRFGPVKQLSGYTNAKTVTLRRDPDASAPVVARFKTTEYSPVEILDATRDFIRIKFSGDAGAQSAVEGEKAGYEGWAAWGAVVPNMSAIVLDAETGAVVSRVPLGEEFTSVAYSPDGSRALFYTTWGYGNSMVNSAASGEKYQDSILAYEVTTDDYKLRRSVVTSDSHLLAPLFYSPVDGAVAAFGRTYEGGKAKLSLMRIGDFYTFDMPTEISAAATTFAVSPDGLTGFISHPEDSEGRVAQIDVVDLRSMKIRNKLSISPPQFISPNEFVINDDGSEIYLQPSEGNSIQVVDTWTGQTLRELPPRTNQNGWPSLSQGNLVGDSLFIRYWDEGDDEMHQRAHAAWVNSAGIITAADTEIENVVKAGGRLFAINADGTRLFALDKKYQIQERLPIDRPELRQNKMAGDELTIYGLSASPDGRHIIVFVGIYQGC